MKRFYVEKSISYNVALQACCGDLNCSDNNSSEMRIMYLSSMKCVKNNLNSSLEIALVSSANEQDEQRELQFGDKSLIVHCCI